ncbi:hypothetical protein GOV09_06405 [Candidatus Woesearchaeota archaeon]|nr:hypothetical protein [Candidatus Woesearchaeota archaeon]
MIFLIFFMPIVNAVSLNNLTIVAGTVTADVNWETDEAATAKIEYGLDINYGLEESSNLLETRHSFDIEGLGESTQYFYAVESCTSAEDCATEAGQFVTKSSDPFLEVSIPEFFSSNRIDLTGKTVPLSKVQVYINGELKRSLNTDPTGVFEFSGVGLPSAITLIRVVSIDPDGLETFVEQSVTIDSTPPRLEVKGLDKYSHEERILIQGTVDEEVLLEILLKQGEEEKEGPPQVEDLKVLRTEENLIELEWNRLDDIYQYVIYRDGKALTTINDNQFIDPGVNKATRYTYEIAAFDADCTKSDKSSPVSVTTPDTGRELDDNFDALADFCVVEEESSQSATLEGNFSESIELFKGKNIITITATDKAGNTASKELETTVDTEIPIILETNLDQINPSYHTDVTIRGKVSKQPGQIVTVYVTVNGKEYSKEVDEEGNFAVQVKLERKLRYDINEEVDYDPERRDSNLRVGYGEEFGTAWYNSIEIIAKTESGLESEPLEIADGLILATCGYGSWWSIDVGEATPEVLTPRLMLEGQAQIGIPVNSIEWQGGSRNGSINYVDVTDRIQLSDADKSDYDFDWIQSVEYTPSRDGKMGYVLIKLRKLDGFFDEGMTTLEMENNLSDHRKGDCLVPGLGCLKIPLVMDIDFAYSDASGSAYTAFERSEIELTKQRQCWNIELTIDRRLPSDKIPEGFLRSSIDFLNETINGIDSLLKPLNAVKQALFYTCAGSILVDFALAFQESFSCEFSSTLSAFGEGGWNPYFAETGQCEEEYIDDADKQSSCQQCEDAIRSKKEFQDTMKWVCDRIFCPSAPTFMKYARDISKSTPLTAAQAAKEEKVVSDCAYGPEYNSYIQYTGDNSGIKKVYADYVEAKEDEENKCGDLHAPSNDCCAFEYMEEWDPSCLIMDELKESKCAALEDKKGAQEGTLSIEDDDCGTGRRLWNSVAGFCEPDGTAPTEVVPAHDTFKDKPEKNESERSYRAGESSTEVWFRFLPQKFTGSSTGGDDTGSVYSAQIGIITSEIKSAETDFNPLKASRVSTSRVFKPFTQHGYFDIDTSSIDPESRNYQKEYERDFMTKYVTATKSSQVRAKQVYHDLQQTLGVSDKEYIVDPTSGLLRSFQCGCFPGITSYLSLWKRVMEAIRICFETVLYTGDGSAGMCKAVLSVYVCDLIYELVSCFTKKFGTGYERSEGKIGNFFGALTSAGGKISNDISDRYGSSTMYKALFAERKLVHNVCLWAFTGTWDLDVTALLEEDVSIDVNTVAAAYPCERRFVSFNPTTSPPGLTTYNYHLGLGMVAGSEMNYRVTLVCSDDYSCDTATGECDCVKIGRQERSVSMGSGRAARGQVIEEELWQDIRDAPWRYDKMVVSWISDDSDKNGQTECSIDDRGGKPPAFCDLDVAEGMFRCDLGYEDENYIRFFNEPQSAKDVFTGEDTINVKMKIVQRQPADVEKDSSKEFNPYTKLLVMKTYNHHGVLLEESEAYPFNGNGVHEIDDLPGYRMKKSDFEQVKSTFEYSKQYIQLVELKDDNPGLEHPDFYISFEDKGVFTLYTNLTNKTNQIGTGTLPSDKILYLENGRLRMVFKAVPPKGTAIHIIYKSTTPEVCTSDLKRWKMDLTFYDKESETSDKSGQISTYLGQQQKKLIDIPVRCKAPGELDDCWPGEVTKACLCGTVKCEPTKDKEVSCVRDGVNRVCKVEDAE